jgi:sugar (pentulose or hexulose) kinase
MHKAILGIDIGTTTICGVAIATSGEFLASVERPNDSAIGGLPSGRAEQAPTRIRERVFEVLRELRGRVDEVTAIGLTGQMHGMVCVDADNQPVSNLITWQDGRCLEPTPRGNTWLDEIRGRVETPAWDACGCLPANGFLGTTLYWMVRNHALPERTARVCFIHDWLAGSLAAQLPVTDPSDAGSAGVFDLANLRWHGDIVSRLDLPMSLLPPVRESGEPIGSVSTTAAAATGIPAGTPVCNAVGDNQASVIGSMADMDHSVLINMGTGGQISWTVPSFLRVAGMETRYLPRGRYMLVGASLCGGRAYAWLNDVVRNWLGEFGCQPDRETVYARLNELAAATPADCGGLSATTTFAGTRADPGIRGGIAGISLNNCTLGNAARAVLTGIVDELCGLHEQAGGRAAYAHTQAVASGNAVRKNPLLAAIISSRTQCPVLIPRHREEAAFGASLLAGVGTGAWSSLAEAGRCIRYA